MGKEASAVGKEESAVSDEASVVDGEASIEAEEAFAVAEEAVIKAEFTSFEFTSFGWLGSEISRTARVSPTVVIGKFSPVHVPQPNSS